MAFNDPELDEIAHSDRVVLLRGLDEFATFRVTLRNGAVIDVRATGYGERGDQYIFEVLAEGASRPVAVPWVPTPIEIVEKIRSG